MRSTAVSCSFYNTTNTFKPADASAGFFRGDQSGSSGRDCILRDRSNASGLGNKVGLLILKQL